MILGLVTVLALGALAGFLYHRNTTPPPATGPVWTPVTQQRMSHGRFTNFTVYVPHSTPKGFIVMLSGSDGWTAGMNERAERLAEQGAMVAGLDVTQFNSVLEADGAQCVYPDGDLENLSHFVQAYFRLPTYLSPILGGESAGATLAYATLAQAPAGTFAGAVSMNFCPDYPLKKPLCPGSGIEFTMQSAGPGVTFLPSKHTGLAWTVLQTDTASTCAVATVKQFVSEVPGASFVPVPAGAAASTHTLAWGPAYSGAFNALMDQHSAALTSAAPAALGDLPIVTVAAQPSTTPSDTFAIILSGDGGWAGLDKEVAGALAATGIPVIGLDSLRYFWSARTPAGLAGDIDRITSYYLKQLGKQHVLLIGYSQGADVLPFAVNRLSATTRSHVALTAIIGMSEHALFEFHMSSWISDDDSGPATRPEVERISGIPVLCIYGDGETDTLCPLLNPHTVTIVKLKGGHHFDGDYAGLARAILAEVRH